MRPSAGAARAPSSSARPTKLEAATTAMVQRHRAADAAAGRTRSLDSEGIAQRDHAVSSGMRRSSARGSPKHPGGAAGRRRARSAKSNRTDNDSAKMATSKGVIQGLHGRRRRGSRSTRSSWRRKRTAPARSRSSSFPSSTAMQAHARTPNVAPHGRRGLSQRRESGSSSPRCGIDALDRGPRHASTRDERFSTQARHRACCPIRCMTSPKRRDRRIVTLLSARRTSSYDAAARTCVCPAGHAFLNRRGAIALVIERTIVA